MSLCHRLWCLYGRCMEKQSTIQHIYIVWLWHGKNIPPENKRTVDSKLTSQMCVSFKQYRKTSHWFWINGSPDLGEIIDELSSDLQKMMWLEFMITCEWIRIGCWLKHVPLLPLCCSMKRTSDMVILRPPLTWMITVVMEPLTQRVLAPRLTAHLQHTT